MYSFASDYLEGAHSAVLERLFKESCIQHPGYGEDSLSLSTEELIKNLIGRVFDTFPLIIFVNI